MKPELQRILELPAIDAASLLLGLEISRLLPEGEIRLRIVETEAYHQNDPASHSFRGMTDRTAPMFEAGGRLYIYFTYGMHYCINIVTGTKGRGEAVLLRAGEPLIGIDSMLRNRKLAVAKNIANGPARLAQALGITDTSLSGCRLSASTLQLLLPKQKLPTEAITVTTRVGIQKAAEAQLRFYISGNSFISRP